MRKSVFRPYLKFHQILFRHDESHEPTGHCKLAPQQTGSIFGILVCGHLFSNVASGILLSSTIFLDNHHIVVSHVSIHTMRRS